jgi:hypothetical protein
VKPQGIIPRVEGTSEAVFFQKNARKQYIAWLADVLRYFDEEGKKPPVDGYGPVDVYEEARERGGLGDLQKFLESPEVSGTTRGKLFNAYKAALADSDRTFGAYTDSINWKKEPRLEELQDLALRALWVMFDALTLGRIIKEHGWTPPTLAQVRARFVWLFRENASLWPKTPCRDKTHRTTIRRMGLPLAKDKIGRPRKK